MYTYTIDHGDKEYEKKISDLSLPKVKLRKKVKFDILLLFLSNFTFFLILRFVKKLDIAIMENER